MIAQIPMRGDEKPYCALEIIPSEPRHSRNANEARDSQALISPEGKSENRVQFT
jgi:hypothetical protein